MLIGVLCEVVSVVASVEKEEMTANFVKGKLRGIVEKLDVNDDCQISKAEFQQILENAEAAKVLRDVDVDVVGLVDSEQLKLVEGEEKDNSDLPRINPPPPPARGRRFWGGGALNGLPAACASTKLNRAARLLRPRVYSGGGGW